ncbi:P27 family phage terminase small subunit [Arthrobacter woluwensis]|uniref:P27 family phage terminase small subunit n=1 Tax=Arthrobacter woluwensis TaxID=156980 RepID=UPI001AAF72F9|nr:P27 family phage terminase small subunit [Arthrobacter woluwensis]QTF70602.1 P27 family phage terminase small subunit [Arthrobacter woluwensis]
MATPGRKPKPALAVVREGNPGHRPLKDSVKYNPSDLREPRWHDYFPGNLTRNKQSRDRCHSMWMRLAPTLSRSVGLVGEQQELLVDLCITWVRIWQCERAISEQGLIVTTERGQVKNAHTAPLNQYRAHMRSLIGELGLSPAAATRISSPEADDEDDPFD